MTFELTLSSASLFLHYPTDIIGHVSFALETRLGAYGAGSPYSPCYHIGLCFVLVVLIELFPNSVIQLYCPKDYYKQKQWNTLPVTVFTEIIKCNRLLWWLPWHWRQVLVFGGLD